MGFTSLDDLVAHITAGNFYRSDWNKITVATPYVAGRWYDMGQLNGVPLTNLPGEMCINGTLLGTMVGWTPNGTNVTYSANTMVKTAGTTTIITADSMYINPIAGHFYRVSFNITAISGTITATLGGTAGAGYNTTGIKTAILTAADATVLHFDFALAADTITMRDISVTEWGTNATTITPMAQNMTDINGQGRMYHNGNVMNDTKHVLNAGIVSVAAAAVPGVWMLVDQLLVYPYLDATNTGAQTCYNTNTLPDTRGVGTIGAGTLGAGVRAFVTTNQAMGAGAPVITMSYTNSAGVNGRAIPVTLTVVASCIAGSVPYSGVAANNYGPFIPLQAGDIGIRSVQSITFSISSGTAGTFWHLILCRPLLVLPITTVGIMAERDFLNQLPSLPRIYDGANLQWLFFPGAATVAASTYVGYLDFGWA
jgi:hypothetical protein